MTTHYKKVTQLATKIAEIDKITSSFGHRFVSSDDERGENFGVNKYCLETFNIMGNFDTLTVEEIATWVKGIISWYSASHDDYIAKHAIYLGGGYIMLTGRKRKVEKLYNVDV